MTSRKIGLGGAAVVIMLASGQASAQNALGDGRGLQRDLRQDLSTTKIGNTPVRDFNAELRFRNSIVTGSAPGGLSFRGDVGYRDPGDFVGRLGSDDLYGFRRDSLYSGLAGAGIRGTDALQYQFALTTGNATPPNFMGSLNVPRAGSFAARDPLMYSVDSERWSNVQGSLRSTASYGATRSLQPTILGIRVDNDLGVRQRVIASGNLGVHASAWERADQRSGDGVPQISTSAAGMVDMESLAPKVDNTAGAQRVENTLEGLRDRLRGIAPITAPQVNPGSPNNPGLPVIPGAPTRPVSPGTPTPGTSTPATPQQGGEGTGAPGTEMGSLFDRLRAGLRGDPKAGAIKPDAGQGEKPDTEKPTALDPAGRAQEAVGLADPLSRMEMDKVTNAIRAASKDKEEESLVKIDPSGIYPSAEKTYGEQMIKGQQQLAAGEYFFAEERFSLALALRPGDSAAMLGRVHAELGAGLFVSAAMNLRGYLKEHPELAAVRFAPKLAPQAERIVSLKQQLRDALAQKRSASDHGLLLAYVGYQSGDKAALQDGMTALKQGAAEADTTTAAGRGEAALAEFLGHVWTSPVAAPQK
jgi:hypothetical protein